MYLKIVLNCTVVLKIYVFNLASMRAIFYRVIRWRGWFLVLSYSQHPRFPIKQAVTSCPAKRPRVTNARAECSQSCVSLHPSQPSARKIGATCHPLRIRLPIAGGDSDSSHRLQVFNAFIIHDLMILSLIRHLQRNLLRIQQPPCARKELACVIHWFSPFPPVCLMAGENLRFLFSLEKYARAIILNLWHRTWFSD